MTVAFCGYLWPIMVSAQAAKVGQEISGPSNDF